MKKSFFINNVYTLVGTSFIVLVIPVLLKLIRTPDSIDARELFLMFLVMVIALYCYIQSLEKIIISPKEVCLRTLFDKTVYERNNHEFVEMGKIAKRSLAGSAYGIEVKNVETQERVAVIELYAFKKRYSAIVTAIRDTE